MITYPITIEDAIIRHAKEYPEHANDLNHFWKWGQEAGFWE